MSAWWYIAAGVLALGTIAIAVLATRITAVVDDLGKSARALARVRDQLTGITAPDVRPVVVPVEKTQAQLAQARRRWADLRDMSRRSAP